MNDSYYLMWLLSIEGLGNRKAKVLIDSFGSAENIWNASGADLKGIPWLTHKIISDITSFQKHSSLEKIIKKTEDNDIRFISIFHDDYPKLLKEINDAPLGLYIKGEMPGDNFINISVIGSRRCSEYGLTAAFKLSRDLAEKGITIVSGMAKGIDSMAHKGALEAKGKTIAVFGSGLDICYPAENFVLMNDIIENGCVISEYPPGMRPLPMNFPARNRIISGLSRGVLVVEAAEKSGTGITVEQALEQGRDIFAVPGSIFSKLSIGANRLIKDGACLVLGYEDVLEGLGIDTLNIIKEDKENRIIEQKESPVLTDDEKTVYSRIGIEPVSVDEICLKIDFSMQITQFCLTTLELKGCIQRLPGQRYIRRF